MKRTKTQKGITLIALIITIIVLLILAIVTIGAIKNDGLIQYAQNARKDYTDAANKEQEDLNTLLGQIGDNAPGSNGEGASGENTDKENLEPISKTETYIGYYADVDGNGSVDGIIYADLAKDDSGHWGSANGLALFGYSYSKKDTLNNYYISQEKYKHLSFEEKPVIAPIDKVEENDRFYVMTLEDDTAGSWYYNAYDKMSDYTTTTSNAFGTGKENTKTMMSKVYGEGLVEKDIWNKIDDEVSKGWFVPSYQELSAFVVMAGKQGMTYGFSNGEWYTDGNYSDYGLYSYYWTSSQRDTKSVWRTMFNAGEMYYSDVNQSCSVRLSTTF